jgi:hypothetical protein
MQMWEVGALFCLGEGGWDTISCVGSFWKVNSDQLWYTALVTKVWAGGHKSGRRCALWRNTCWRSGIRSRVASWGALHTS